ncbi:MAG: hypothetical protein WCG37_09605 [Actinomycetes bacterium]
MNLLLIFANTGIKNPNIWYPTILGVLVVLSAFGLFIGGTYLLVATNTGARLGFLIVGAALSGMLMLLSTLWWTTASPLNTLKGRIPGWNATESIAGDDFARSKIEAIQTIGPENKLDVAETTNVKAAIDALVVIPKGVGGVPAVLPNEFQTFESSTDYLVAAAYTTGGEAWLDKTSPYFHLRDIKITANSSFPWVHVTAHVPSFAVAVLCPIDLAAQQVPFGDPIPAPTCDPEKQVTTIVLQKDLGSLRFPPFMVMVSSGIMFALFLLGLHWRERDLQELAEQDAADKSPTPAGV